MAELVPLDEAKANEVRRQVEFYFSNSNLPRDWFLRKTVEESPDGLVSIALICSFVRMRTNLGLDPTTTPEKVKRETVLAVAEALRSCESLKVSEDGERVGRSTELLRPEEVIEEVDSRTIFASPLPFDVKIGNVESLFGEFGKVNCVRLPRHVADKRKFCGTALIEYSQEDVANNILKERLVFAGAELELGLKKDFDTEREKKRKVAQGKGKIDESEVYPKGLILTFHLNKQPSEASTEQNGAENLNYCADMPNPKDSTAVEGFKDLGGKEVLKSELKVSVSSEENLKSSEDSNKISNEPSEDAVKGAEESGAHAIHRVELESGEKPDTPENIYVVTREDLKQFFQRFGIVKFVDYRMGETSGYIRFEDPDAVIKARAMAVFVPGGGLSVKNHHFATLEALTGEAEKDYWSTIHGNKKSMQHNSHLKKKGKKNRSGISCKSSGKHTYLVDEADE